MDELWNSLALRLSEMIEQLVTAKLRVFIERFARAEIKLCYSETEAAKQLGVSRDTLANWRKRGIISYCRYPSGKADQLSDLYSYDLADLLSFREKFKVHTASKNVFEISKTVSLAGAELRKAA